MKVIYSVITWSNENIMADYHKDYMSFARAKADYESRKGANRMGTLRKEEIYVDTEHCLISVDEVIERF